MWFNAEVQAISYSVEKTCGTLLTGDYYIYWLATSLPLITTRSPQCPQLHLCLYSRYILLQRTLPSIPLIPLITETLPNNYMYVIDYNRKKSYSNATNLLISAWSSIVWKYHVTL